MSGYPGRRSSRFRAVYLKIHCAQESPGDLVNMQISVHRSGVGVSNKLPGDAQAAGSCTTLHVAGV